MHSVGPIITAGVFHSKKKNAAASCTMQRFCDRLLIAVAHQNSSTQSEPAIEERQTYLSECLIVSLRILRIEGSATETRGQEQLGRIRIVNTNAILSTADVRKRKYLEDLPKANKV